MKICVIGLGSMGKRRIRLLKRIRPDAVLTGIDQNPERAGSVFEEFEIDTYASLEDIKAEQDCAFVCTPPQYHGGIIKSCLEKGLHVFSEINLIDDLYDENIRLAEQRGRTLFLSSTPFYKEEMRLIDSRVKENGRACGYRYHVGQYLPDWHPWDALDDFFASSKKTNGCRELLAIELPWLLHTFGEIEHMHVVKGRFTGLGLEFPDTYFIQMEHAGGSVGSLVIDVVSREAVRKLEVFHEDFYIRWDGTPDSLYEKDILSGEMKQVPAGDYIHEEGYGEFINEYAYAKEIEEFFKVTEGQKTAYGFKEDKETLKLIGEIESQGDKV